MFYLKCMETSVLCPSSSERRLHKESGKPWQKGFSRTARTKYHEPGDSKQQKFMVSVLEDGSPKSTWRQGCTISVKVLEEDASLSLPASVGCQHSLVCGCIFPMSASLVPGTSI